VVFDFNAANDKIVLYGFTGIGAGATELTVTQYSATQYGIPGGSWTDISASSAGIDFRITLLGTHTFTVGTSLILNAGTVGTSAADAMTGTASDEFIFGELGNDTIDGGAGNDSLFGSDGNDSVLGGNGNDSLSGGYNNDILIGGAGIDTMEGGSGTDTFTFVYGDSSTTNTDVIWDFKEGVDADKIDLSSATLDAIAPGGTLDYSDLVIETPDILGGMYTRVSISGSDFAIYLIGYYESGYTLSATDFIF
jgi:Ca2+-binding RTX toxin-like protein